MVADNPEERIKHKAFHAFIDNDHAQLTRERANLKPLPQVRKITQKMLMDNYRIIQQDIKDIVDRVMEEILKDPDKGHLAS